MRRRCRDEYRNLTRYVMNPLFFLYLVFVNQFNNFTLNVRIFSWASYITKQWICDSNTLYCLCFMYECSCLAQIAQIYLILIFLVFLFCNNFVVYTQNTPVFFVIAWLLLRLCTNMHSTKLSKWLTLCLPHTMRFHCGITLFLVCMYVMYVWVIDDNKAFTSTVQLKGQHRNDFIVWRAPVFIAFAARYMVLLRALARSSAATYFDHFRSVTYEFRGIFRK